jgi:hypothetical protein
MPQIFEQALGGAPPQQPSAYDLLLQELQKKQAQPAQQFTPDQVRQRITDNNSQASLGMLGQLAGDQNIQGLGGQVFKQALGDRKERVTNRGVTDPLTGETMVDPEYAREQDQVRRGQILTQALGYEEKQQQAREREAQKQRDHQARLEEIRFRGSLARRDDAEMTDLKKQALQARIDAADYKRQSAADKAKLAADQATSKADLVMKTVDEALGHTGTFTTGLPGTILSRIPGSEAYDLRKTIDTVKANVGFNELAAMRAASPTGGALGQVAVKELDMLQATLGSLDPAQSEEKLRKHLDDVRTHYNNWRQTMAMHAQSLEDRSGQAPATRPGSPTPGGVQPAPGATASRVGPVPVQTPSAPTQRLRLNPATGQLE